MIMNQAIHAQLVPDADMYPFKSKYIELSAGKMHYIDEGKGDVILFVHGTPTWSFLYRKQIQELRKTNRCIAIDHLGFGLSEKPLEFDGKPESHAKNLVEFIEKLDLQEVNLVVHDFGGPIGLGAAITAPSRINRIALFNTWLWETKNEKEAQKIDRILNGWMGRFMYLRMNFSPKVLLKKGFADKKKLTKKAHRHYKDVFPNKDSRYGMLRIGQALVGSSDWYQAQWEKLEVLEKKPWMIMWGMQDEFIRPEYLERWKKRLPNAQVKELDCGHFVQEEAADEVSTALQNFFR